MLPDFISKHIKAPAVERAESAKDTDSGAEATMGTDDGAVSASTIEAAIEVNGKRRQSLLQSTSAYGKASGDQGLHDLLSDGSLRKIFKIDKTLPKESQNKNRLERIQTFRGNIVEVAHSAIELSAVDLQTLVEAGMAEEEAKRFRRSHMCDFCCLKRCGDPSRGNTMMRHDPRFWQNIFGVGKFFWDISDNGKRNRFQRVFCAIGFYVATIAWKIWLLMKLSFGIWDEELIEIMEIKYRSFQLDI